jgi:thiol-disulfide isomerase/thioredoxin
MTSAGLVLVGMLAVGELLLTLLLARKVRQLDAWLTSLRLSLRAESGGRPWLAAGTQIPAFEAQTTSGEPVSLERLLGQESMVGFFSPGCTPCREQLPAFARLAGDGGRAALAVIVGPASTADELLAVADGTVPVLREAQGGPVTTAFAARAFPGIFLLDPQGRVVASGATVTAVIGAGQDGEKARP